MDSKNDKNQRTQQEIERIRDDAMRRALRTPPTHLKDIPKKRQPRAGASSGKKP